MSFDLIYSLFVGAFGGALMIGSILVDRANRRDADAGRKRDPAK